MVEQMFPLDSIFGSLADPTRRDILRRVASTSLSVGEIARSYDMSLAAISKHLKILEQAKLVRKRRVGKHQFVSAVPTTLKDAADYLSEYEQFWANRTEALARIVEGQSP